MREVDDAAVAALARMLGAQAESRITFRGLSRHLRRVLRYVGIDLDDAAEAGREPRGASAPAATAGD